MRNRFSGRKSQTAPRHSYAWTKRFLVLSLFTTLLLGACNRVSPVPESAPEDLEPQALNTDLWINSVADSSGAKVLDASEITGEIYVFVTKAEAEDLHFYLDDPERTAEALSSEALEPQKMTNDGAAFALDTRNLSDGIHTLTVALTATAGQPSISTSTFLVNNQGTLGDSLWVSASPDRSAAVPLAANQLTGKAYIFAMPQNASWVEFSLDGKLVKKEKFAFFDFAGTAKDGSASPFDIGQLKRGEHTVSARIQEAGKVRELTATFAVVEPTAAPPPQPKPQPEPSPTYSHLEQIFISPTGSNSNTGSKDRPLKTVTEGLKRANDNRKKGLGTRLNLASGVYRESLTGFYASSNAPLIVIEALESGKAVISGADVWTDWSCDGTACSHAWSYNWGVAPNPWSNAIQIGELARRREMVLIDGTSLEQKLSRSALTTGSFYVDEGADRLYVKPPAAVNIQSAKVEVAVRPTLMRLQGLNNLVIKGLTFQHAATPFRSAAVEIVDQNDVLIENSAVQWNGQSGLSLKGYRFTIRNTVMSHNGSSGVSAFKATDVLLEDTESSYNNWRGIRGNYTSWEVGQKFSLVHRLTLKRHVSEHNAGKGFWFDTDVVDAVIEDSRFCHNLTGGIFIEKNQGPIRIQNSTFCDNGEFGMVTSATHKLTLQGNLITDNHISQIRFSGDYDHPVTNWETGQRYTLNNEGWVVRNNQIKSGAGLLFSTTHPSNKWQAFMNSAGFDYNTYASTASAAFLGPDGKRFDFPGWQNYTRQDAHSSFTRP